MVQGAGGAGKSGGAGGAENSDPMRHLLSACYLQKAGLFQGRHLRVKTCGSGTPLQSHDTGPQTEAWDRGDAWGTVGFGAPVVQA